MYLEHIQKIIIKIYLSGTEERSRGRSSEIDRRCTYRPLSLEEDKSIFSTVYGKLILLEHVSDHTLLLFFLCIYDIGK